MCLSVVYFTRTLQEFPVHFGEQHSLAVFLWLPHVRFLFFCLFTPIRMFIWTFVQFFLPRAGVHYMCELSPPVQRKRGTFKQLSNLSDLRGTLNPDPPKFAHFSERRPGLDISVTSKSGRISSISTQFELDNELAMICGT